MEGHSLFKATSLVLAMAASLLATAPALAASPAHVTLHHGTATYVHGSSTYTVTQKAHGFMVTQTNHGKTSNVNVMYRHPGAHNLIYVRNGCIVYIDYDNGVWTGYYYYVC
jgi:hypothetical protein